MSLSLNNLDEQTRAFMLEEVEGDAASGHLYNSKRFSATGTADYPGLLRQAVSQYDETWLAARLRENGRINTMEQRGQSFARVPSHRCGHVR